MTQTNAVGKRLVAQHRVKTRQKIKRILLASLVGTVVGLGIGFTVSDFWSLLINRCSNCGQLGAEKTHKENGLHVGPNYYSCQPRPLIFQSTPPDLYLDR